MDERDVIKSATYLLRASVTLLFGGGVTFEAFRLSTEPLTVLDFLWSSLYYFMLVL